MIESVKTELGQLIDCSEEEFLNYCADKDVGYLSSFHNLMVQTYNQVHNIKNELVTLMSENSELKESEQNTLEGLYAKLLRIEQRVFLLRDLIKNRGLKM